MTTPARNPRLHPNRPRVVKDYWHDAGWVVFHRWGTDVCTDWQTAVDSANVYARLAIGHDL